MPDSRVSAGDASPTIAPWLIHGIVFIEGFCSLGAEVIALRRLLPHVGSAIVVTAPTIAFFLLALALGYAAGGRVERDFAKIVARNFLLAAFLTGIGLAAMTVDGLFAHLQPALLAYLFFVSTILGGIAWLLGQTVPILTNQMRHLRTGEASGRALYWSTLGSFLGSLSLSLGVMQLFGVHAAVLACTTSLLIGALLLSGRSLKTLVFVTLTVAAALFFNLQTQSAVETAYADYRVRAVELADRQSTRAFLINNSTASLIDESKPPRYARYIEHIRRILLDELAFRERDILVLGAGGFTLSHREPSNHYTFVDIDPRIRDIAEKDFLGEPLRGEFIADDARRHVSRTQKRFAAVIVDVYSSHTSIPSHLVTREFWQSARQPLASDGVLIANLILDGRLATPFARNLLATIDSVFGRCAVEVLHKGKTLANVVVTCFADSQPASTRLYQDELNTADIDRLEIPGNS